MKIVKTLSLVFGLIGSIIIIITNIMGIWGEIKMIDKILTRDVVLIIIIIASLFTYIYIKIKEFRNKLQSVLLFIVSAHYGVVGKTNDVTDVLRSKVVFGRIEKFPVTNSTLGPDPAKGDTNKKLTVKYMYCGEFQIIEIPERGILSIP